MYKKVSTDLNFVEREKEIINFWNENEIFKKSMVKRDGAPSFTFYDGPPTANGMPHIGHILTRVIKDIIPRYKWMNGYNVLRKAGWDTHGLPVELEVEKKLGIDGKDAIEDYGIEPFIEECKKSVWKYEQEWRNMSDRVGFWADMDDPYVTYHNNYIESIWWSLKKIWDKGLLYSGHKVVPYCPRCGTALSSHEVAQGYQDVTENSITAKFKVVGKENEYILAWTTTPWTLPSNVALCVHPEVAYAKAKKDGNIYILANDLLASVLKDDYEVVETVLGKDLVGIDYEPLYTFAKSKERAHYVIADEYVTTSDGTGVVHNAPAFGEDDARVGRKYNLPFVQLVNTQGKFDERCEHLTGLFVKDADPIIIKELTEKGIAFEVLEYAHNYPHCWRCHTPLIYYARHTWFIEMTKVRDTLLASNDSVNWYPPHIKDGRFGNFLENVIDWGLSRERYWGTPLPIWECECGHRHAIGSIEELKSMSNDCPDEIELHRPYIDNVHIKCDKCGGQMSRVPEVIDCWYDSGAMPFAQFHYPFENKELFEEVFPADFISEAIDQTRGWFYSLIAISTLIFDKSSYKNCIVLGHVNDKDGKKMSKHIGNVVDPWSVLDKQGADAVRWYFYVNSAPWLPNRFYEEAVSESQRKFMGTLWNTYAFYVLYAEIDEFNPFDYKLEYDKLSALDKWALSKLNTMIKEIADGLDNYKITEPARALSTYVDNLSNWYVRRSRERFWAKGMPQDKINAYMTLYTILTTLTKAAAPFVPFMTEAMYQNLVTPLDKNAPESVHLSSYPKYDETMVDTELEQDMDAVLDIVVCGRAARNVSKIKNRQPLLNMFVKHERVVSGEFVDIIKEELNVKDVEYKQDVENLVSYKFKPQLRTLGPRYGRILPKISAYLQEADGSALMDELKDYERICFNVADTDVTLLADDVLIETGQAEGYATAKDGDTVVSLSTTLTDELIEEGFVREVISKIQTMRKEADFEVMDKIKIFYNTTDKLANIIKNNSDILMGETLCDELLDSKEEAFDEKAFKKEWSINDEKAVFAVMVIKNCKTS